VPLFCRVSVALRGSSREFDEETAMGTLRKQMDGDLVVRGMSVRTREAYVGAVAKLAKHYGRSPDRISEQEVQSYLLHLIEERKLSWSSCNIAAQGLRFFYRVTLKRSETQFSVPTARQPQKLPQILSREEVAALIEKTLELKHRAILMTAYGTGLRLTEICHLRVSDIDSKRMTVRVEQGKGAKDRYTLLSPRLLAELRRYWHVYRPAVWLFTGRDPARPIGEHTVHRIYHAAKARAGILKEGGIHSPRHAFARARAALNAPATVPPPISSTESVRAFWQRVDIERCPHCGAETLRLMQVIVPHTRSPP
jgi:integrase/recombinase XerD